jgi:hypothetical protein
VVQPATGSRWLDPGKVITESSTEPRRNRTVKPRALAHGEEGAASGRCLTGVEETRRRSSKEGAPGHGGAPGPSRGRGGAVRSGVHGRNRIGEAAATHRQTEERGGADKMHDGGALL